MIKPTAHNISSNHPPNMSLPLSAISHNHTMFCHAMHNLSSSSAHLLELNKEIWNACPPSCCSKIFWNGRGVIANTMNYITNNCWNFVPFFFVIVILFCLLCIERPGHLVRSECASDIWILQIPNDTREPVKGRKIKKIKNTSINDENKYISRRIATYCAIWMVQSTGAPTSLKSMMIRCYIWAQCATDFVSGRCFTAGGRTIY